MLSYGGSIASWGGEREREGGKNVVLLTGPRANKAGNSS
jgi:hypothetical protein